MDETTHRSRAEFVKCQEQIEQSREMIEVSVRWLTAYRNSVNRERQSLSISEREHTISSQVRELVI